MGNVYEYIGLGYKIIDATEISDYSNITAGTIFKRVKSYSIVAGEKIDIRGYVTNRKINGSIYVKNNNINETDYDEAWVEINDDTIILDRATGKITSVDNINSNVRLEVSFRDTYTNETPARGVAKFIIILD
ncbi:hypothetical protein D3C73_1043360 [compost metagenome]